MKREVLLLFLAMLLLSSCGIPQETSTPERQALSQIEISNIELCQGEHPDTKVIKATIKNNYSRPFYQLNVTFTLKDEEGNPLKNDSRDVELYVMPGDQKELEVFVRNKPEYKNAELRLSSVKLGTPPPKPVVPKPQPVVSEPPLTILPDWKWVRDGDYCYVRGSVKNTGTRTIYYFKVTARFMNDKKQVVDSDYTNDLVNLRPGEAQKFEIMHKYSPEFKYATAEITDISFE